MNEAELAVSEHSTIAEIGWTFPPTTARRNASMPRGYIPDERGLTSVGHPVLRGDAVTVDEGLALYRPKS